MKKILLLTSIALFTACGGGSEEEPNGNAQGADHNWEQPTNALDCEHFNKRASECIDDLMPVFAATWKGEKVRGESVDEKVAAMTKGFGMMDFIKSEEERTGKAIDGSSYCNQPIWGNLSQMDPGWHTRYAACDPAAPCADWSKCVGAALGDKS